MQQKKSSPQPQLLPVSIFIRGAKVISGSARGRRIGIPTINIEPAAAPEELKHGVYGCRITISGIKSKGAMHYGPRPVFKDSVTLEVHVLDAVVDHTPETVDIEVIGRIRDVQDFPSTEALKEAIKNDIAAVHTILSE